MSSYWQQINKIIELAFQLRTLTNKYDTNLEAVEDVMKQHVHLKAAAMKDEEIHTVMKAYALGRLDIKKLEESL